MASSNMTIRINDDLKQEADELFAELGITLSAAINLFLRQSVREGGLPFVPTTHPISSRQTTMDYAIIETPNEKPAS
ncbi:MAG: type II toxin-antitoxin system RelB/DinJ family antitoxin [Coriobacteriia bacterium]|nr:type II toxin-antitoxin system RelB/DinJ family antitoxin [Coriobacteriia bacterium]